MPGANSKIAWQGARSEVLAEYVFSSWGPVLRGRGDSDYGVDLFCALSEPVGQRAWVRQGYTVQVKSNLDPWKFTSKDEVRWLVNHPSPLFLCTVDRAEGELAVYQTMARFNLWADGELPASLSLVPSTRSSGSGFFLYRDDESIDLGPPIIRIVGRDVFDQDAIADLQPVLAWWLDQEAKNIWRSRNGFRSVPSITSYSTNTIPPGSTGMRMDAEPGEIHQITEVVSELLDRLGRQFFEAGVDVGVIESGLLMRYFARTLPIDSDLILTRVLLSKGVPGEMYTPDEDFADIDELQAALERHPAAIALLERLATKRNDRSRNLAEALALASSEGSGG